MKNKITIIGSGNLGLPLAYGIANSGITTEKVTITRRSENFSEDELQTFNCTTNNRFAVRGADIVILAVRPDQLSTLAGEIKDDLENQLVISTITGATILKLQGLLGADVTIARSMPNIGIKTGNSMTCLAFDEKSLPFKEKVESIFNALGKTLIISENNFAQATVLCGSGIAIIAKFARAYMQAGIQNGFSEHDALAMAIQVLKGTVSLLEEGVHPEVMIDKVTTPGGCTISTLVEMEHQGFASSLLKSVESGVAKAKTL